MSAEENDQAMMEYKKVCNRMYPARSRATKRAIQEKKETVHEGCMQLRPSEALRGQTIGVYQARGAVRMEFDIMAQIMNVCRLSGECFCNPVAFTLSRAGEVHAVPCSTCASTEEHRAAHPESEAADPELGAVDRDLNTDTATSLWRIVAKYVRKDTVWRIVGIVVLVDRGSTRQAYRRRTGYCVMGLGASRDGIDQ